MSDWDKDPAIQRFRQYLRIPSVHPDVDYDGCVAFLRSQAQELQLPVQVYQLVARKPVVAVTWAGTQSALPTILLNSHMDVVPVFEECWTHPPFEAKISDDGFIFARGTQDMKGVGMMHLEALRRLKEAGIRLKRTVHVCFVPDEEIGGVDGMKKFAQSEHFKALNVGFALDESCTTTDAKRITAFYGEKVNKQVQITCRGNPGHGSLLPPHTAGEKLHYIIDKFMKYRVEEKKKYDGGAPIGDVTSVNLTQIEGGVQVNIIPENLSVSFDVRVPLADHLAFEEMVKKWCAEAGEDVSFKYLKDDPVVEDTNIDESNVFWTALNAAVQEMGFETDPVICCGTTDARFVRQEGIPAIGLSPMLSTPILLHAHDERIHVDVYKQGIDIMEKILLAIANA